MGYHGLHVPFHVPLYQSIRCIDVLIHSRFQSFQVFVTAFLQFSISLHLFASSSIDAVCSLYGTILKSAVSIRLIHSAYLLAHLHTCIATLRRAQTQGFIQIVPMLSNMLQLVSAWLHRLIAASDTVAPTHHRGPFVATLTTAAPLYFPGPTC